MWCCLLEHFSLCSVYWWRCHAVLRLSRNAMGLQACCTVIRALPHMCCVLAGWCKGKGRSEGCAEQGWQPAAGPEQGVLYPSCFLAADCVQLFLSSHLSSHLSAQDLSLPHIFYCYIV